MSAYEDIVPFRKTSIEETQEEELRREGERRLKKARTLYDLVAEEVAKFLYEVMKNDQNDLQARLRAADMLATRQISKVAAQHAPLEGDIVESIDVVGIRDSIIEMMKKNG